MSEIKSNRFYNISMSLLMTICLALSGWALNSIAALQTTVKGLESSQFGKSAGLEVWKEIGAVRREIALLSNSGPPQWFIDRVGKMELQLDVIEKKLDRHVSLTTKPQF